MPRSSTCRIEETPVRDPGPLVDQGCTDAKSPQPATLVGSRVQPSAELQRDMLEELLSTRCFPRRCRLGVVSSLTEMVTAGQPCPTFSDWPFPCWRVPSGEFWVRSPPTPQCQSDPPLVEPAITGSGRPRCLTQSRIHSPVRAGIRYPRPSQFQIQSRSVSATHPVGGLSPRRCLARAWPFSTRRLSTSHCPSLVEI